MPFTHWKPSGSQFLAIPPGPYLLQDFEQEPDLQQEPSFPQHAEASLEHFPQHPLEEVAEQEARAKAPMDAKIIRVVFITPLS